MRFPSVEKEEIDSFGSECRAIGSSGGAASAQYGQVREPNSINTSLFFQ